MSLAVFPSCKNAVNPVIATETTPLLAQSNDSHGVIENFATPPHIHTRTVSSSSSVTTLTLIGQESDTESDVEGQKPLQKPKPATPIPWKQISTLCAFRVSDPLVFAQILPYINDMLLSMKVSDDPSKVGIYSGFLESAFSVAILLSCYPWARFSDAVGRRPVLLYGMAGLALTTLGFMVSTNYSMLLFFRTLSGLASGNVAAVHAVLGEMTDDTNAAKVFPIYGLCFPVGSTIGSFIGGTFADAPEKWPSIFSGSFFTRYPYAVPSLITAAFTIVSFILGYSFLHETHPALKVDPNPSHHQRQRTLSFSEPPPSPSELLKIPIIRNLAISGFFLCFQSSSHDVVFALFAFTPVHLGGLGFDPIRIGTALTVAGIMGAILSLMVMPSVLKRWSPATIYQIVMGCWPLSFAILPPLNYLAEMNLTTLVDEETKRRNLSLIWIGIMICLAANKIGCCAYGCSMLLVRAAAPAPNALGSTNGVIQFSINLARAISPAIVGYLFSVSTEYNLMGGSLWAWFMVVVGLVGLYQTRSLRVSSVSRC